MKKLTPIALTCVLVVSLVLSALGFSAGAAGYDGVTGYQKAYDFNNMTTGDVAGNGGNTAASPIRGNGGFASSITEEWNYFGESGKSLKFTSSAAQDGCIQLEMPHDDTNGRVWFADNAYNAFVLAVKVPAAPAEGADSRGFAFNFALNDWGTYYKLLNTADTYKYMAEGETTWTEKNVNADCVWLPYGFEGLLWMDTAIFYNQGMVNGGSSLDDSRLGDYDIQHEVLVEFWPSRFNGSAQGALYLDDIYLRTDATASDMPVTEAPVTTTTTQATPVNDPLEVNDFESATVGSAVSIGDIAAGLTVTATDKLVGNGSVGVEFNGANDGGSYGYKGKVTTGNGISFNGKDSLLVHVVTPSEDSSKNTNYNGFLYEMIIVAGDSATHWLKLDAATGAQMMADDETTWSTAPGSDSYNFLPYGWSGWLKYDLSKYAEGAYQADWSSLTVWALEIYTSQCGGAYGSFGMDSLFAVDADDKLACGVSVDGNDNPKTTTTTEKTTTTTEEIVTTTTTEEIVTTTTTVVAGNNPIDLSDFESFTAGSVVAGNEDEAQNAVWNGYGFTVKATDEYVGNGSVALEFSSDTQQKMVWSIIAQLKATGDISGKEYFVFHIATPSEDSLKSPAYETGTGEARFAFSIIPKTNGAWHKTNTLTAGNVFMLADGEATWKDIPGDDFYNYLPFGWSGWVMYDISAFNDSGNYLIDTDMQLAGMEFWASQCGKKYGNIYLDSFFAIDSDDVLACGLSADGMEGGQDSTVTTTTRDDSDLYIPTDPTTTTTEAVTTTTVAGGEEDNNPSTGVMPIVVVPALAALAGLAGALINRKRK